VKFPTETAAFHRAVGLQSEEFVAIVTELQQRDESFCPVSLANGSGVCYSLKVADEK
jgi:hypothetical protein